MKTGKIFKNGQSQAVRLPKEFRLKGSRVLIKRQGRSLLFTPIEEDPWAIFSDSLHEFSKDFMEERKQPTEQKREDLF
jgi:antitoxin VapB